MRAPGSASPRRNAADADRPGRSATLLERHRNSLVNVLIEGGSFASRFEMAQRFHDVSLVRTGPLVHVDASVGGAMLRDALLLWAGVSVGPARPSALIGCERGTLFLDRVDACPPALQRLLFAVLSRAGRSDRVTGPARFIAGTPIPLAAAVAANEFLPPLFDALDKVRIALEIEPEAA